MSKHQSASVQRTSDPETWVDRYGDYLYSYALARTRNPDTAEDLVQETFLAALAARERFKGRSSEKTWLTAILKNKLIDLFRKSGREEPRAAEDLAAAAESFDHLFDHKGGWKIKPARWAADPVKIYEQREFLDVLRACLTGIPERMANVFVLREMEGSSTEEICKTFDISTSNCWVILYRARMLLRRCLERTWFRPAKELETK